MLDKELLPIYEMPKFGISEQVIVKISKKRGLQKFFGTISGFYTKKSPQNS